MELQRATKEGVLELDRISAKIGSTVNAVWGTVEGDITKQTDYGAWGVFILGLFLWIVLGYAALRADRGGPQRKIGMRAAAEWCLPGRKEEKEKVS